MPGIDPGTSRMLSERSTIWATPPWRIIPYSKIDSVRFPEQGLDVVYSVREHSRVVVWNSKNVKIPNFWNS